MGKSMEDDFKEIIEKNLPDQVGDVLYLNSTIDSYVAEISSLRERIRKYEAFDARNTALDQREAEITQKEREFRLHTLEYQMAAEKEKTKFAQDVAMGLVRNTSYRESVYHNELRAGYYDNATGKWVEPTKD